MTRSLASRAADKAHRAIRASIRIHRAPVVRRGTATVSPINIKLIGRIIGHQDGICPTCDLWLENGEFGPTHPLRPTIDHVVPKSRGGKNVGNRIVMHRECNIAKGNRPPTGCELIWLASVNARLGVKA